MNKITLFIGVIIFIIILVSIEFPIQFRFQDAFLNYLFIAILFILLPFSILLQIYINKEKLTWVLIFIPILIISSIIIFFISFNLSDIREYGFDKSFEVIQKVKQNNVTYKLYRSNGGATTSYRLVLKKERNLPLGLKIVTVIWEKYPAYMATLEIIKPNTLKVIIEPYSEHTNSSNIKFTLSN